MVFSHKKITFPCAIVDFTGVMKINVYTTHDKLSAMTEATSELVIWRNGRLATLNPDHAQPYGLLERHALLVRDGEAVSGLFPVVDALLADPERMRRMAANIRVLGIADSAERIVDEIVAVVRKN